MGQNELQTSSHRRLQNRSIQLPAKETRAGSAT